jgi:REP element-mobilizing transposase RayT
MINRRHHLPHTDGRGTACLTWRLHRRHASLKPEERDIVQDVLVRTPPDWCELLSLVVMDDHVHVLVRTTGQRTARQLAQAWKSISSHEIVRSGYKQAPVWQAEYFDRWMRNPEQEGSCARYILANPERRWPALGGYRWVADLQSPLQARRIK